MPQAIVVLDVSLMLKIESKVQLIVLALAQFTQPANYFADFYYRFRKLVNLIQGVFGHADSEFDIRL